MQPDINMSYIIASYVFTFAMLGGLAAKIIFSYLRQKKINSTFENRNETEN